MFQSRTLIFAAAFVVFMSISVMYIDRYLFGGEFIQIGEHKKIDILGDSFTISRRAPHGVVEIHIPPAMKGVASSQFDQKIAVFKAMGFTHGMDRMLQMTILRWIGQGRLSEHVPYSNETIHLDVFMRQMEFRRFARKALREVNKFDRQFLDAYSEGVNHAFHVVDKPFELKLLGVPQIEPWTSVDCIQVSLMVSWIGMASVQGDIEKWFIQSLQNDKRRSKKFFREMFKDVHGFNDELQSIDKYIGKIKFGEPFVPNYIYEMANKLSAFKASNNWCVGGEKTESGFPMCAADPHLAMSMFPGFWYEMILNTKDGSFYHHSFSIPGVPGSMMGRNKETVFSLTYGWMDQVDYFIEECKGLQCRVEDTPDTKGEHYKDIHIRKQTIWLTNKKDKIPLYMYKSPMYNDSVLDVPSSFLHERKPLDEGYYLSRRLPTHGKCDRWNTAVSFFLYAPFAQDVYELQTLSHKVMIPMNFLFADSNKNIMYQQTGAAPKRISMTGLLPVPSWNKKYHWSECVDPKDLINIVNPEDHILVTANNNWNSPLIKQQLVNLHMGEYRSKRARQMLEREDKISVEYMRKMQSDVYSLQAEKYMNVLRPVIPKSIIQNNPYGKAIFEWDNTYHKNSTGALVFELMLKRLYRDVFGKVFGKDLWEFVRIRHVPTILAHYFDTIILAFSDELNGIAWNKEKDPSVALLLLRVLKETLEDNDRRRGFGIDLEAMRRTGKLDNLRMIEEREKLVMQNMVYAKILPQSIGIWLGLNYGPVALEGSTTTLSVRHKIYDDMGEWVTAGPAFRMVADMGDPLSGMWTVMVAGPSDRWRSKYYSSPTKNFFSNIHQYNNILGKAEK